MKVLGECGDCGKPTFKVLCRHCHIATFNRKPPKVNGKLSKPLVVKMKEARLDLGITLPQAARLLRLNPSELKEIEVHRHPISVGDAKAYLERLRRHGEDD